MRLDTGTWVLVADGAKALILENAGDHLAPNLQVVRKEGNEAPDNRGESTAGSRGKGHNAGSDTGPDEADQVRHMEEHDFAEAVAKELYAAAHRGRFERLVIVAPPKILGTLRKSLHKEVAGRVVGEVHKTLTGHPVHEIERIIGAEPEAA